MALGDHEFYVNGLKNILNGIDWENDTIKVALLSTSHTPDYDADEFFDDVSGDEVSDASYAAGGVTLANAAVSADTSDNEGVADADNAVFSSLAGVTVGYAVVYKSTGTPATSPLISLIDCDGTSADGGDFTIVFDAEGILNLTKA